jgi:hypothetical protein
LSANDGSGASGATSGSASASDGVSGGVFLAGSTGTAKPLSNGAM